MTHWIGIIAVLVTILPLPALAACTTNSLNECTQGLERYGVGLDDEGAFRLLETAKQLTVSQACGAQFVLAQQCLDGVIAQCGSGSLNRAAAESAKYFLESLCTPDGMKGVSQAVCLSGEKLRKAQQNCTEEFRRLYKNIIEHLLQFLLSGDREGICLVLQKSRLCIAQVTASFCGVQAAMFTDQLGEFYQQASRVLRCHKGTLEASCFSNRCQNGGTCLHITDSLTGCVCALGFGGRTCGTVTGCVSDSCAHDGRCSFDGALTTCTCEEGYFGPRCRDVQPLQARNQPGQQGEQGQSAFLKSHTFIAIVFGAAAFLVLMAVVIGVLYCRRAKTRGRVEHIKAQQRRTKTGLDSVKGAY